jgi:Domain of unknown function (DUF6285)
MYELPSIPALLALARDMLLNELTPLLPDERKTDALLVAEAIALAARQAEDRDDPIQAVPCELEMLYKPLTPPSPQPSPACGGGLGRGNAGEALLRRFANDLRKGAFETSQPCDQAARAILWRLTIAKLRQSNPNFLAANGFD